MRVKFWGTRGSIPKPGPSTIRYGGNTSCVEVRSAGGTIVILDCGTGALALGADLMRRGEAPIRGHLLISHTHWDHIQGLPFFAPMFVPGNEWDVYAPHGFLQSVRETLAGQMQHTYFPVDLEQLGAEIRYHNLTEGVISLGDIEVRSRYLNHPALTLGYRLEADGVAVAYCCDHEPHSRQLAYGSSEIGDQDREHIAFVADADLLIHDSQYRAAEYETKIGWGHSTLEAVATIARCAGVKSLAFTHHDPGRDDDTLDKEVAALRKGFRQDGTSLNVFAAAEGQIVELGSVATAHAPTHKSGEVAAEVKKVPPLAGQTVLLGIIDPDLYDELWQALHADGVQVLRATTKAAAVELAASANPALIILERYLPGDGLETSEAIRAAHTAAASDLPVIIVAAREEIGAGTTAGVTDWLLKPFSAIYARARMRAWLMRVSCRWAQAPIPENESERLAALHALGILDTAPEERFDAITRIATATFDVPVALVTLVDANRQWFKSACGASVGETSRDISFCAHVIVDGEMLIVPDALLDPRFADNPAVVNEPRVRFYAGYPLMLADAICVGTLCLVDTRPRQLDAAGIGLLKDLASLVLQELKRPRPSAPE